MKKVQEKKRKRARRHLHVRKKVRGTADRPRMAVFKSLKHIACQVIDDDRMVTLTTASTYSKEDRGEVTKTWHAEAARRIGEAVAQKAIQLGIKKVVFDRGGFRYHGRVKALAEAARKVFQDAGEPGF